MFSTLEKIGITLFFVGIIGFMLWAIPVGRGMSVRENIIWTSTSYSWEQWCWRKNIFGQTNKIYKGSFALYAKTEDVGQLQTTLCD